MSPTLSVPGVGEARAYWVDEFTLAWPVLLPAGVRLEDCVGHDGGRPAAAPPVSFGLVCAPDGGAHLADGVLHRGERGIEVPLGVVGYLEPHLVECYPQLAGYLALTTRDEFGAPRLEREDVEELLTGQLLVVQRVTGPGQWVTACTGVQTWPVVDALWGRAACVRDGGAPLGVYAGADGPGRSRCGARLSAALWAPTARRATVLAWPAVEPTGSGPLSEAEPQRVPAQRQPDGRWVAEGALDEGSQYLWEVEVYMPSSGTVERNLVTDPYARGLTTDSRRAVALDMDRRELRPSLWRSNLPPVVVNDAARVIYEVHVRDFSAADPTVEPRWRGTYAAFTRDTAGTRHLRALASAGVDTVHLMPITDFSSVPEDRRDQEVAQVPESGPASTAQQEAVGRVRRRDAYNWGYDPWHWMVPEGSYASEGQQDGGARVRQVREMVGALHGMGLQVVLDVVFNHTAAAGGHRHSVLDRIVPGYYHRLDAAGRIETSACGTNTATERAMMERLLIDACVSWVRDYRVDGFRFDLMGYHSVGTMRRLRQALAQVAGDAVGHPVYLYGEGWDMGEVAGNRLFRQAVQGQVGAADGLGIATFNDRVRDAMLGASFGEDPRQGQGLGSGLAGAVNAVEVRSSQEVSADLAWRSDVLRLALAGNIRGLDVPSGQGAGRSGEVTYGAAPVAYGDEPTDSLAYVGSHDDETLWDTLMYKLDPGTPVEVRMRYALVCLAAVTLGQSPVLWSAGVELLRSKSLDRDSYDSGDWFNAIDWSGADHRWGRGLPPAWRNFDRWVIQAALLAGSGVQGRPSQEQVLRARDRACDLLRIRRSTPLLTLGSAALIRERVSFPPCRAVPGAGGEVSVEGVVVMVVDDGAGAADVDPALDGVVVAVNPRPEPVECVVDDLVGRSFELCDVQAEGADAVVRGTRFHAETGVLSLPGVSAVVLVER